MKKAIIVVSCLLISLLFSSCQLQNQFNDLDNKVVFIPSDVKNIDLTGYETIKFVGRDFFFKKIDLKHALTVSFHQQYTGKGKSIVFKTDLEVYDQEEAAMVAYKINEFPYKKVKVKNFADVDPYEYQADRAFIVKNDNSFTISLQKKNVFYRVDIRGLKINENQVKANLIKKINNVFTSNYWKEQS